MVQKPPLLATKLQVPRTHETAITRQRLLGRLDEARRVPLTVIAAPPGFGKTTLLADWSNRAGMPTAWLSLDEGDNDPTRFWSYVIAALERVRAGIGQSGFALLPSPRPPPIETILTVLLNDLGDLAQHGALVLEDYHVITSPAIHQAVAFLIDHMPSFMHVIITSRADPPLPLARWRARGQLVELRTADFGFQPEEAAAFLTRSLGARLTAEEVAQLVARTEGWAAGLQLAALSLAHRDNVAGFIRALRGTQRFILDYLSDEVLARQEERVQMFLLQTSVLERLNGSLCEAVTGCSDSRSLLNGLEQANLFVVLLDEERRWYRYHQLFAEFLRGRLQEQHPEQVADLHRRAARWYTEHAMPSAAIGHWLSASEYDSAADLLEQVGQAHLMGGELSTLQTWLDRLPVALVAARPRLCLLRAWLQTFTFRAGEVERSLQQAEQAEAALPVAEREHLKLEMAAVRETAAVFQADVTRIQALHGQAGADHVLAGDEGSFLHSVRHLNVAFALEWTGDSVAAVKAYQEVSDKSQASGNVVVAVLAMSQLADQFVARGRPRQAAETNRRALRLVGEGRPGVELVAALPHLGLALVSVEWNDLGAAAAHIAAAQHLAEQAAHPLLLSGAALALARLRLAEGHRATAFAALDQADLYGAGTGLEPFLVAYTGALRVRLHIGDGSLLPVAAWVERHLGRDTREVNPFASLALLDALDQTTLVRALIALGKSQAALDHIRSLSRRFGAVQFDGVLVELLLLEAMALAELGEGSAALATLVRSLVLAAPEGYVRLYLDEGQPVLRLLSRLRRSPLPVLAGETAAPIAYVDSLLAAFGRPNLAAERVAPDATAGGQGMAAPSVPPLLEPLSEREREVLRLVAAGLSNQEIAASLVVEVSTVKTHLLRLYGKLGVHSRTQAISRAQALHLLP